MADDKSSKPPNLLHMYKQLWGAEITPAYHDFIRETVPINMSTYLEPTTTITQHYHYKGYSVTGTMGRGVFEAAQRIKLNENDIVLAASIKTGSTWVQEILYNLMHPDEIDKPSSVPIDMRVPMLELPEGGLDSINNMPSPRLVKTHEGYELLPLGTCDKKYKIVYVARNPKDAAVSSYFFYKMMPAGQYNGSLKEFLNVFLNDKHFSGPFFKHVLGYWNNRHKGNILVIKYEDLQKDVVKEIRHMATFLGVDDASAEKVAAKCSFQQMANNPFTHHNQWQQMQKMKNEKDFTFMRKGKVGDWKNHFDDETNKRFDDWIEKNSAGSDLTFDYEL